MQKSSQVTEKENDNVGTLSTRSFAEKIAGLQQDGLCGSGQKIMREHTIETRIVEVNYCEPQKIEVERRCGAANDDALLQMCDSRTIHEHN